MQSNTRSQERLHFIIESILERPGFANGENDFGGAKLFLLWRQLSWYNPFACFCGWQFRTIRQWWGLFPLLALNLKILLWCACKWMILQRTWRVNIWSPLFVNNWLCDFFFFLSSTSQWGVLFHCFCHPGTAFEQGILLTKNVWWYKCSIYW